MKILRLLLIPLSLFALLFSACHASPERSAQVQAIRKRGVLQVGTQSDVPRFSYMNPETGELEGFEIDLARHIAEALCGNPNAVAFTIVTTPLRGPLLDNGEVDVVIAAYSITEERKQHYNLTRPYYTDEVGFLVRKDAGIRGLADMEQKIIGVIRGTTTAAAVAGEAEKLGLQVRFWDFPSNPPAIAALLDREIDAFSVDKSILLGYQQEETLILSDGFDPQYYGIALQREQDQLTAYIDGLLLAMYEDGTLSALLRKWGL